MNISKKQKWNHRHMEQICDCYSGGVGGRMEWKTRVQTQALGKSWAGLEEDDGASNPEMGGFSS